MPYRKIQFVNDEIYHIVVRAIDDNIMFKDIDDYYRGIFSIYEFNDSRSVTIRERRQERAKIKKELQKFVNETTNRDRISVDSRDKLVEILTFSFMPNHPHLLLRQIQEEGIIKFMRKVGIGYAGYFNCKYNRKGYVFQSRFKAVHIETEDQLKNVFVYIHTNPIALIEPDWKERGIGNPLKAIKFLENYKWSSYLDYIGKKNFPSVTEREFLSEVMGGEKGCQKFVNQWIKYKGEIATLGDIVLE